MSLADYGTIGAFIVKRIDQVSKFFKKKVRRDNVQGFEKDVDNRDGGAVNKRLSKLKKKCKNRDDSR